MVVEGFSSRTLVKDVLAFFIFIYSCQCFERRFCLILQRRFIVILSRLRRKYTKDRENEQWITHW